ncbi:MAG TPA: hypothetical protein VN048_06530 [Verrucomicrobiae bacterium]|jgi:hypothetical protein|nr:hypothetical protein [Verrucomicrobiae bacterium]
MRTFLLVLQSVALLFAAGAAVASLLKSKGFEEIETSSPIIGAPSKVTRRLTREARIGVSLVIGGLVVSFVARLIEQSLADKINSKNLQSTSNQLALLQASVQEIRHLAGQIRTIDVEINAEQFATNEEFASLQRYLEHRATLYEGSWPKDMSEETTGGTNVHLRAFMDREKPDTAAFQYGDVKPEIPDRYLEWWDGVDEKPKIHLRLVSDGHATALLSEPDLTVAYGQLRAVASKAFQLRFCNDIKAHLTDGTFKIDREEETIRGRAYMWDFDTNGNVAYWTFFQEFLCAYSPAVREAQLIYDMRSKEIYLNYDVRLPSENWERLRSTISLSDLSGCSIFLLLPDLSNVRPSNATVDMQILVDGTRLIPPRPFAIAGLPMSSSGPANVGVQVTEDFWSQVPVLPISSVYKTVIPAIKKE